MYEYRCDERLKAKAEGSTRLAYTGLRGGTDLQNAPDSDAPDLPIDTVEKCSEPRMTSRGRVKRVATLPASFASGAILRAAVHGSTTRRRRASSGDWTSPVEIS
jgi:hypothetical protein